MIKSAFNEKELEGFVRYETTNRVHTGMKHWHSESKPLTMGFLLSSALSKYASYITSMTIVCTSKHGKVQDVIVKTDESEIKETKLFPLIQAKEEDRIDDSNATIILKFTQEAPSQAIIVFLQNLPGHVTGFTRCMRLSLMIPVDKCEDNFLTGTSGINRTSAVCNANPILMSYVFFEDYNDTSFLLDQYDKLQDSVISKHEAGEPTLNELDKAYLHGWKEQLNPNEYIDAASSLMNEEKWLDAYNLLMRAFENCIPIMLQLNEEGLEGIFYLSKLLGHCLENMGRHDEAAYFFLLIENNDKRGLEDAFRILAKLADETVPENERNEAFLSTAEDTKLQYQYETTEDYSCNITVGQLLTELFSTNKDSLTSLTAIKAGDSKERVFITEAEQVWNYPMRSLLEDDTTVIIRYKPTHSDNETSFVIRIYLASTDWSIYRINVMLPHFAFDDDKSNENIENNIPDCISFIMSPETIRFHNINDNVPLLVETIWPLIREGRYFEALHAAKYAYKFLLGRWSQLSADEKHMMLKAAFYVGVCYMDFHLYYKANYYLRLASAIHKPAYMKWYVQSLGVLNDCRTLSVIEFCEQLPNDNLEAAEYNVFLMEVKKRKAYIYIESKRLDDAEQLLFELYPSADEATKQFILSELERINKLRSGDDN